MSWSIEERIGDCRPFPAQVVVYRGETDECLAYVSGEVADGLKAENAKLREERDMYRDLVGMMDHPDLNMQLQAENAKLRELVRDMARAWWACDNERCPHGSSCDAAVSEGKLNDCEMERRMAELGVEVE